MQELQSAIYHINIRTESHIADSLEVNMDDPTKLRIELALFVGELLRDHAALIWTDEYWRIDVTDEAGAILYSIQITATQVAAKDPEASDATP